MNIPRITHIAAAVVLACSAAAHAADPEIVTRADIVIADASGGTPAARTITFTGHPALHGSPELSRFMAMEVGDGGKVVKDAPYSAEAVTETTQALADGNRISRRTATLLQHLAEARRRKTHWLMQEAIREYVEREEKREQFRQDALKAWREFQETGLHVTADEADAWLAKLAEGQDVEPPECHV